MTVRLLLLDTIADEGVAALAAFADVRDARGATREELARLIVDCDGLVAKSGNRIDRALLEQAPRLRVIGRAGSGVDNIDVEAARARGIEIIVSAEGNAASVAEYVLCAALLLAHRLPEAHAGALHNDFRRANWQGRNLDQLSFGIVGVGHIGRAVARKVAPLCRELMVYDPNACDLDLPAGTRRATDLTTLLGASDVVSLNVPLTAETRGLLGARELATMPAGSILINSGRGALIETKALLQALDSGALAAAALDVLDPEPPFHESPRLTAFSHPLIHHPNVYYTPHIAAGTRDALREVATGLARKLAEFFERTEG